MKKFGGELHFLINGDRIARVTADTEEDIYGVVDVFGRTIKVSLIGMFLLSISLWRFSSKTCFQSQFDVFEDVFFFF